MEGGIAWAETLAEGIIYGIDRSELVCILCCLVTAPENPASDYVMHAQAAAVPIYGNVG